MANIKYGNVSIPYSSNDWASNIGAAIGALIGNNEYERGLRRAEETANKVSQEDLAQYYENYLKYGGGDERTIGSDMQAPDLQPGIQAYQNGQIGGMSEGNYITKKEGQQTPEQLFQQGLKAGALSVGDFSGDPYTQLKGKTAVFNPYNFMQQGNSQKKNFSRDIKAEKIDYLYDKYKNSPNPDGDKVVVADVKDKADKLLATADFSKMDNLDINTMRSNIRKQLIKDKRTSSQIEAAMKAIEPTLQSMVAKANGMQFDKLANNFTNQIANGDTAGAYVTLAKLAQISTPGARILGNRLSDMEGNSKREQQVQYLMQKHGMSEQAARNVVDFGNVDGPRSLGSYGSGGSRGYGGGRGYGGEGGGDGYGGINFKQANVYMEALDKAIADAQADVDNGMQDDKTTGRLYNLKMLKKNFQDSLFGLGSNDASANNSGTQQQQAAEPDLTNWDNYIKARETQKMGVRLDWTRQGVKAGKIPPEFLTQAIKDFPEQATKEELESVGIPVYNRHGTDWKSKLKEEEKETEEERMRKLLNRNE